jgi:hypothetical protein
MRSMAAVMSGQLQLGGPPPDHVHWGTQIKWTTEPFEAPDTGTMIEPCTDPHCRINQDRRL